MDSVPARLPDVTTDTGAADLAYRMKTLKCTNRALRREGVRYRLAAEPARRQSDLLTESLGFLTAASNPDRFVGHVLEVTGQQIQGVVGTLWFPKPATKAIRLNLECLDLPMIHAAPYHYLAAVRGSISCVRM